MTIRHEAKQAFSILQNLVADLENRSASDQDQWTLFLDDLDIFCWGAKITSRKMGYLSIESGTLF